jgi:hypothetical protein
MSLFSWFTRKPAPAKPPVAASQAPASPEKSARKNERLKQRELLYAVVRDAMVRAGVLSASYKFKVLALDQHGQQFQVMVDLAREYGGDTTRLSEVEALIAQSAKTRCDIEVTAVYWRINDHMGVEHKTAAPHGAGVPPQAPAAAAAVPEVATAGRHDPAITAEVAAFKRSLAAASTGGPSAATQGAVQRPGPLRPRSGQSDFADTEIFDQDAPTRPQSATQFGDL